MVGITTSLHIARFDSCVAKILQNPVQWTLANPNSLGPEPIQISEIFGLVKLLLLRVDFGFARFRINAIRINEGPL